MATSSQSTVDQAIQFEFAPPGVAHRDEPTVEPPERTAVASDSELDDHWIANQLARGDRWRRPSWPLLCEVAQQFRERRIQAKAMPVIAEEATESQGNRDTTERQLVWGVIIASTLLHTLAVVALAVWAMPDASTGEQDVLVVAPWEQSSQTLASPPQLFEFSEPCTTAQPLSASNAADCPVPPPPDVALATFIENDSGPVVDIHSLLVDRDGATTKSGDAPSGTEFFGVQAVGNRFVFLIDCSVTMSVGTKWMEAIRQLTATVEQMGEDQWFYVICFSEESQPMFDTDRPEPHCLPATSENVERLRCWLRTIRTGMSTQPARSLKFALSLDPDAIFLLSDGEYDRHDPSLELLARERREREQAAKQPFIVHTLSFLNSNLSGRDKKKLQEIASQNGGRYACVPQGPRPSAGPDG